MNTTFRSLTIVLASLACGGVRGGDLGDFSDDTPAVGFDVPPAILCRVVTNDRFSQERPGRKLVEIEMPVSVVVYRGDPDRVEDVVLEVSGAAAGLTVYDYSPETVLASELAEPIEVTATGERDKHFDLSLGGSIPMGPTGAIGHITPGASYGVRNRNVKTQTEKRLPPKHAVVVAGTTGGRTGVFFKLRHSSQTTLEGEHLIQITFDAPKDWDGGRLTVTGVARGARKIFFVEQRTVWQTTESPVEVRLAAHTVAKPVTDAIEAETGAETIAAGE